ncbi:transcriptional regulator [Marivivens niveibacter]|uniref:Transcriptional regulator n=1 Tax=Marivivens niveibacter TaxID=1930667 RepID=A0A251WV21_9RHOB|nr:LysR family transcriptional regulator [Marivivens niveibacter]OUD08101.1 transcriptional regulator [Marivivens niveibacter]
MDFIKRLKPTHLRLLLKIAETGQLQIAASAMAMSQPAASRIIGDIEKQANTALFHRSPKGMEPTPVGTAFIRHARGVVAELDSLEKEVRDLTTGAAGEIRIGTVTGPAVGIVLPVLQEFRESFPDTSVTIEVGPSTELVRGLDEGRFDFIVARIPAEQDSRDFMVHPGRSEDVQLVVRASHPLVGRQGVTLDELRAYDWVIQERGSPIRLAVESAFHLAGVPVPHRIVNTSSLLVVESLLATSDVIAPQSKEVCELLSRQDFGAKLRILDINASMLVSPYFVVRNRGRHLPRAATMFFEQVLKRL